jgi:hypothetical protein
MPFIVDNVIPKAVVLGLLSIATYYVVICPCKVLVACHLKQTVTALGGALATIVVLNAQNRGVGGQ